MVPKSIIAFTLGDSRSSSPAVFSVRIEFKLPVQQLKKPISTPKPNIHFGNMCVNPCFSSGPVYLFSLEPSWP